MEHANRKKLTVLNVFLVIALIGSVAFFIYSSNKNSKRMTTETIKLKPVTQTTKIMVVDDLVKKTVEVGKSPEAELVYEDEEETTFDKPMDVVWEGKIMATFMGGSDYGIRKIPQDKDFPYFYAYTGNEVGIWLEGNVKVKGKWTGITCAYRNTIFGRCVPLVEAEQIEQIQN